MSQVSRPIMFLAGTVKKPQRLVVLDKSKLVTLMLFKVPPILPQPNWKLDAAVSAGIFTLDIFNVLRLAQPENIAEP